jgi:hypothetical protein
VAATYCCLLINGFIGFQFAEDGTPLSIWVRVVYIPCIGRRLNLTTCSRGFVVLAWPCGRSRSSSAFVHSKVRLALPIHFHLVWHSQRTRNDHATPALASRPIRVLATDFSLPFPRLRRIQLSSPCWTMGFALYMAGCLRRDIRCGAAYPRCAYLAGSMAFRGHCFGDGGFCHCSSHLVWFWEHHLHRRELILRLSLLHRLIVPSG